MGVAVDHDRFRRNVDFDAHVKRVALDVVVVWAFHDDAAAGDPIEHPVELCGLGTDTVFDFGGSGDVSEHNLEWQLHVPSLGGR